jgi:protein-S-isoprenylcysteine O-methyltransferase Ste14
LVASLGRYAGLFYALTAYVLAIAYWPIFMFFIGNVPRIEKPLMDPSVSAGTTILPTWHALAIDVALILAFALHHSILARPSVKRLWGSLVPEPFRRATFTQIANIFAFAIVIHWQPIPIVLWQLDHHSVLRGLIVPLWQLGWVLLLLGAMSFKLSALFGLRQVWFWFKRRPYEPVDVTKSRGYSLARHPEFLGVFLLIWVTADMTVGHFLLASGLTIYSFVALRIRERELRKTFGAPQQTYQAQVPMLGPRWAVATMLSLWLVITAVQVVHTLDQRRDDGQARADLHALKRALVTYKQRTGRFPRHVVNMGTFPAQSFKVSMYCEEGGTYHWFYDGLMAELTSVGLLDAPLAHPNRRPKDPGYCYLAYQDRGKETWLLWTSLPSSTLSNRGEPTTCRPFESSDTDFGSCRRDRASQDYCLCVQ